MPYSFPNLNITTHTDITTDTDTDTHMVFNKWLREALSKIANPFT